MAQLPAFWLHVWARPARRLLWCCVLHNLIICFHLFLACAAVHGAVLKPPPVKVDLVCRLPALVHQYFNAQQCEDMPSGLSLYGNLAAPLPQHMAAIRQSLINDHAMYLEEVHQRLAALLPPSAAGEWRCEAAM